MKWPQSETMARSSEVTASEAAAEADVRVRNRGLLIGVVIEPAQAWRVKITLLTGHLIPGTGSES
jgi:hypothetical protein